MDEERLDECPDSVCRDDDTDGEKQGDAGNMAVPLAQESDLIDQKGVRQEAPAHEPEEAKPEPWRLAPRLPSIELDSCREQDGSGKHGVCRKAQNVSGFYHVMQPTLQIRIWRVSANILNLIVMHFLVLGHFSMVLWIPRVLGF